MLVHPWDAPLDPSETWEFVRSQGFGHLVAPGRDRELPVVVPTQFLVVEDEGERPAVVLHLARPNPVWAAVAENPVVMLSVAGDWAYVPSAWKAIGDEDPSLGIPTTYYAAAQLIGTAAVATDDAGKLDILRAQLTAYEPDVQHADPSVHAQRLDGIRGMRISVRDVIGKFKYGGNVDAEHRRAVAERLATRNGPGDEAARRHLARRSGWVPRDSARGE